MYSTRMGFHAQVKVRFSEVDNAGIVYYPRFFDYFHVAFEEMFSEKFGVPYVEVIGKDRVGFPAVHAEVDFQAPLHFGNIADVEIGVARIGAKSVTCTYRLTRLPGKGQTGEPVLSATGKVTIATVSMDGFGAIPIPDKYRKLFEGLQDT